jgi:hypothetical protein
MLREQPHRVPVAHRAPAMGIKMAEVVMVAVVCPPAVS